MPQRVRKLLSLFGPFLGLVFVYLIFFFIAPEQFRELYNTKTVLTQGVIVGIGALGMTLIIISGGIDLSPGSVIALTTVATALVLPEAGSGAEVGRWLPLAAVLVGVGVATLCGLLNGLGIAGLRIVPFIVTLGMMQIARGAAKGLAGQTTVNPAGNWLSGMMIVEPRVGAWWSVAPGLWVMILLTAGTFVLLKYTVFGRYVFAIGSSESTARLCGVRVGLIRVAIYGLGGMFFGVAGVMQFSSLTLGDPTAAVGMELDIIAAVVIGGGSLSGGEGSAVGSIVGALIMAVLRNGCTMVGIPNYVQNIVVGAIIIAAVGVDRLKQRRES